MVVELHGLFESRLGQGLRAERAPQPVLLLEDPVDAFRLGVSPVVRISGDIEGTPGATVIGPAGTVELSCGVIVAMRHVHISPEQAGWLELKNGDLVSIKKEGVRALVFDNVPVRCGEGHNLELHLDMEEANAGSIKNGELLEIVGIVRKT